MEAKCELIKDLLPLYVEGLCGDYTMSVVDEHVARCRDCGQILKTLAKQDEVTEFEKSERKKNNPLGKIRRRNIIITVSCVLCAVILTSVIFARLFMIGTIAPTSDVNVKSIEMLDGMTFKLELRSNSNSKAIVYARMILASSAGFTVDNIDKTGVVYVRATEVFTWPLNSNSDYVNDFGLDQGALGAESIKAIYLVGKDESDVKLVWEAS